MKGKGLFGKWKGMPNSARSAIVFVISSFLIKGITFLTTPIFTRLMDPTQYGIIATFNSWQLIVEVFALLGLTSAGVFNVGLNDYRECRDQYVSNVLTLCNLMTVVVFSIIFAIKYFLFGSFLLPWNLIVIMFINLIFSPAKIFWLTRQKYEYKYKAAFIFTVLSTILSQAVAVLLVMTSKTDNLGEVKIWSSKLVLILLDIPVFIYIFVKGRSFFNFALWKKILILALPLIPHYLAQHVMSGADRIMLSDLSSGSASGIYSVVANIGVIAGIVWTAINASLVPYTFEKLNNKEYDGINNLAVILIAGFAVVCVAVSLVAPEIMAILAPEKYYGGVYAVPPIIAVSFLSALYNVYANMEFYHKKTVWIALSTVVAMVINLGLNAWLIPKFSYTGAAYTTLISHIVLVFMHFIGYKRCCKEKIYNNNVIFLISVICIALCVLSSFLYKFLIVRYAIIVALIIVGIIKRKSIIKTFKKMKERNTKKDN